MYRQVETEEREHLDALRALTALIVRAVTAGDWQQVARLRQERSRAREMLAWTQLRLDAAA